MSDAQPQQQQQQAAGGQQPQQLLRADDILKLQSLPDDEKQKYRLIMQNFWGILNQHPANTTEHAAARQKLSEWSQKFIARERNHRSKMKAAQQQAQQQQQQQQQGAQAGQQNQGQVKQEGQQAAPAAPQQSQGQPSQPQGQPRPGNTVDPTIVKHVAEFPIQLPPAGPTLGTPEYDAKVKDYRTGYLNMLVKQASYAENRRKITTQIQERQNAGQEIPPEFLTMKARVEKEHAQMKEQVEKFRRLQKQWKDEREQKQQAQGQPGHQPQPQAQPLPQQATATPPQPPQPQPQPQRQLSQPNIPAQPQIKEEPQIKIEGGQTLQRNPTPTSQFNMQGNQQQMPQQQQNPQAQQMAQQQQQQVRPPPAPHAQSMPVNQGQQFAQQNQQQNFQQQQQQRPQINPMQANAMQHQQTNSPHPASATGNGPPVPLSHQAAVSAANRSYTDPQRTNTPMQQGGIGSFGNREREQLNNPKMPIPRHLNVTTPSAVHMGQSRPTLQGPTNGAPGPMGQPVIPRPPPFQLEGEGDRVLSKRKLDELVRQVTGGSEEALTPEVEEAVLQLADEFVDNVIGGACKLAKLRESPQLDIRDVQVILERNYNIRIPGYASDEVRTVRKIVPAPGWAAKMNAVSAAKVMGGKTDF